MKFIVAALLSLGLLLAGSSASFAVAPAGSSAGDSSPPIEQGPVPPADVGPPLEGSQSSGPGMTELVIGAAVVGGAFAIGFAADGGLAAGVATAAAVLLIYSVLP